MLSYEPFHVVGIDETGCSTVLYEADNSGTAKHWFNKYISKENAGNWPCVMVLDTRDECAETLWRWEREQE